MRVDLFDFDLPEERIALAPASPRDAARLLVVRACECEAAGLEDRCVADLPALLRAGDALVLNDTRVLGAALSGRRRRGAASARIAVNLHKRVDAGRWRGFARPAKRLKLADRVRFAKEELAAPALEGTVVAIGPEGEIELAFDRAGCDLDAAIEALGDPPLPPYITARRGIDPADRERYQTIYAKSAGAVAAPTAGLHFTEQLFAGLERRGISRHFLTLHVGAGTFLPVKVGDTAEHRMHAEWGEITPETAASLNAARGSGGRIVAVGTTSLRLLEAASDASGRIRPYAGETHLFITPGYRFRAVDLLMTNFHLPRSTLFMLVAAFSGLARMQRAYVHATAYGYRFYSYGDACLLYPAQQPP
jgi:S-adenosylmethionine:tRNA ribosyltransferase-isomerase